MGRCRLSVSGCERLIAPECPHPCRGGRLFGQSEALEHGLERGFGVVAVDGVGTELVLELCQDEVVVSVGSAELGVWQLLLHRRRLKRGLARERYPSERGTHSICLGLKGGNA